MPAINAWYRTFQFFFNIGARAMPWRKAKSIKGAGAIQQIPEVLIQERVQRVMVITDPGLMAAHAATK